MLVIDLHAHVLPGLDDGPETLTDAIALAERMVAAGTRTVAATPHIDGYWGVDPAAVPAAVGRLRQALADAGVALEVLSGGEVALDRLTELTAEEVDAVALGDARLLLLEAPLAAMSPELVEHAVLAHLRAGKRVLIAHPERSPAFQREPTRLAALVDEGARCQITAGSVSGRFGGTVRDCALTLLREGLVHDVASDAHDARRRPPELREPLAEGESDLPGLSAQVPWLTEHAPRALLDGTDLPPRPPLEPGAPATRPQGGWRGALRRLR